MREDHIKSAVAFLHEPQVASAASNKKVEFLESKGLTSDEINEASRRSSTASSTATAQPEQAPIQPTNVIRPSQPPVPPYMLQQPPPIPQRDWKDYFVMATVSVGVAYGLYTCAKRYLLPAILPPTPAALEADKEASEQEFQRTEQSLEQLQQDTSEMKQQEKQRNEEFAKFMTEANDTIREIKEHAEDRKQEMKSASTNVETLRDMLPRALEKHSETSAAAIAELQTELKSLKQLVSRTKTSTSVPVPPASAVPTSLPGFPRKTRDNGTPNENGTPKENGSPVAADSFSPQSTHASSPQPGQSEPSPSEPQNTDEEPFIPDPQSNKGIPEWQRIAK